MMMGSDVSLSMARHMLDLVLLTDTPASYNAALSIIQLLHGADQAIKLEATRRVNISIKSAAFKKNVLDVLAS